MRTNEAQWHIIVGIVVIMFNLLTQVSATVYAYADFNETEVFDDMEASFGPNVDSNGITGLLVPAEPIDACKQIKISPFGPCNPQNITIASFALIERGGCDFGLKVWNAQAAGFCGAIVYNVNSDSLVRMSTSVSSDIYIPSVFIGETSAIHLNSTYLYNDKGNPYIQIYEYSFNPLDYYLVPFIVVIGVCFVSLLCFLLVKCLRDRRRARRGRLSLQRLKKLPVKKFDKGDEYDVCAICLEDYEEGDSLRILPCDHAYHCKCVDPWLTSNKRICPLCKRRVLSDDESSTSSEDVDDSSDDEQTPLVRPTATSPHSLGRNRGYGSSGSYSGQLSRQRLRSSSTSSIETTSTDIPEPRLLTPKNTPSKVSSSPTDHSKVNQSFTFTEEQRPNNVASAMNTNVWMDPDDYLNTAEAVLTGPRVSESSITVLPDLATHDEIHGHSYSSEDFHSLDESVATVENSPKNSEARSSSAEHDTDQDDIIVITPGSRATIGEDDGEV